MNLSVIRFIISYLKPYRFRMIFILIAGIISTVFSVILPALTGQITSALFAGTASGNFDWEKILFLILGMALLYLLSGLFGYLQSFGLSKTVTRIMEKMRLQIDEKINHLPLSVIDGQADGNLASIMTNDVDTLSSTLSSSLIQIVTQALSAAGILIMMFSISPTLAWLAVGSVPAALLLSLSLMKTSSKSFARSQQMIGEVNGYIQEMVDGQQMIQAANYTEQCLIEFNVLNDELTETSRKANAASGLMMPVSNLSINLFYVLIAVVGCFKVLSGNLQIGDVQAMLQYSTQFSQPFLSAAGMASSLGASFAAGRRIMNLLNTTEEKELPKTAGFNQPVSGELSFENVNFGYTQDKPLMKNVSFEARAGQKIAIVGPTGAGKTTLVNLIMRFYDPQSGMISIDSQNTETINRNVLRSKIGMVLQDPWLFEGTIMENLQFASPEVTREKAVEAARLSQADAMIRTLPDGYDMKIEPGASNLSAGEKQMLTIARAMAADPEIMILDEATSSIDSFTEYRIQQGMKALMKGRTSFVIAHRLSTIRDADLILYMENGNIEESGTHDELMKKQGRYAALYESQFQNV